MKLEKQTITLIGIFVIAITSSTYCNELLSEPILFPLTNNSQLAPTFLITMCRNITNQPEDPPNLYYPVGTHTITSSSFVGTSNLPSTSTTTTI
ncbi:hypothetical protein COW99_02380 [Candidatus Roizmanbacteria bacterium CG22_combo_CG10-13_8_21_14_all_38_20]|uniref:Uncharacterized protein n=1 Tax=Candidatus Roizmanbacteria bacterium CG22_combo_CG10-13_8_21_14_all_38_20 TaxID=1974862 RepID=A0A2H0BVJ1_9BACT|nr:hypothetical protein [Candidatus Microgenomates bacterium]PIP61703.1 MAG: hypothetical protein COW99_02380 [Candidatus Roizmanbacteria bacterium CG22_combo_CG10-13_8_21_14_all_38_20]PJC32010.1 MAG: hypothetical protein CO050_00770 [Candidatus Roizmanbacteria bacterium CG_4_9_14_0_2_um_filter_38_17]